MAPEFVYFDLDDTLLNHRQAQRKALFDIHDRYSLFDYIETERFVKVYHKINGEQWYLYNLGEIGGNELKYNRFALTLKELKLDNSRSEEIGNQYLLDYQNYWQWIDGAERVFDAVRRQYKVGILTNGFTEIQEKKFRQFDLYNRANELVISEEAGVLKPHPEIFEYATKLAGCLPEDILYIGDSFNSDVIGGVNYGWRVAWLTEDEDEGRREKADFVLSDIKELINLLQVEG